MMKAVFERDLRLAFSRGNGLGVAVMFFCSVVVVMPFNLGIMPDILARLGGGMIWVAALLSLLMGFDRLFLQDVEDGSLDILRLHSGFFDLCLLVIAKAAAHWLGVVLPVMMAAPVMGILLDMDFATSLKLLASLLIASPAVTLIGVVAAALTRHLPRGGLLMAVMILPLSIPIIIFAISGIDTNLDDGRFTASCLLLLALNGFWLAIGSLSGAAALKYL